MEDVSEGLRKLAPGFTRFSIKADDTVENAAVHAAFKEFCKVECDNNYTMGLKLLLRNYEEDGKLEMLYQKVIALENELEELKKSGKPEEKETGVF